MTKRGAVTCGPGNWLDWMRGTQKKKRLRASFVDSNSPASRPALPCDETWSPLFAPAGALTTALQAAPLRDVAPAGAGAGRF